MAERYRDERWPYTRHYIPRGAEMLQKLYSDEFDCDVGGLLLRST